MEDESEDLALPEEFSDGEEEEFDEKKHSKLIDAITSIDGKKKNKLHQRTVPTNQVSEFGFTSQQSKVKLNDLVGTLKDTGSHKTLRKHLRAVEKRTKVVSVPLHKHEQGKIERSVAYEKTTKELNKWDPVVEQNRQADQLIFPLNQPNLKLHTTGSMRDKFQPRTPLELEVAKLLQGNQHVISKKTMLTPAEENALKVMSLEEAKERRAELQKHRALLSYREAKARWQKKIKSKKYHRVLRKEKLKNEKKVLETLEKTDPEAFHEKIEAMHKQRIQERMSLKHRGGSKFARKQMIYAKFDDQARQNVQDMLQKSRQLTEKAEVVSDSDSDGVIVEDEDDTGIIDAGNNPWMATKAKTTGYEEVTEVINNDSGFTDLSNENNCEDEELVDESVDNNKDDNNKSGDVDQIFTLIDKTKSTKKSKGDKKLTKKEKKKIKQTNKGVEKKAESTVATKLEEKKTIVEESDNESEDDTLMTETLDRKRTYEDMDKIQNEIKLENKKAKQLSDKTDSLKKKSLVQEIHVDPKKLFTMETSLSNLQNPNLVDGEDDDDNVNSEMQQKMTIAQAFADDDVVEEFSQEKAAIVEEDKPKDINLVLPGWGEWGGEGLKPSKHKKKKFIIKADPAKPREDRNLGHVIIHEQKDPQIKKHQVSNLPFPYVSVDQYEKSIRAPIGKDWNPETAFKQLVKPKVITKIGTVIDPMDKSEMFKKQKDRKRKADMNFDTEKGEGKSKHSRKQRKKKK